MFGKGLGPIVVTTIVLGGFCVITFLAMKPEAAGVKESVVLYLLGAWQSMAAAAVAYWIGSSAGSSKKDDTISAIASNTTGTGTGGPVIPPTGH